MGARKNDQDTDDQEPVTRRESVREGAQRSTTSTPSSGKGSGHQADSRRDLGGWRKGV